MFIVAITVAVAVAVLVGSLLFGIDSGKLKKSDDPQAPVKQEQTEEK